MALREEIAQKAAQLGLDRDELMINYTLGLMRDATDRYGIDVDAAVNREKLSQAGREFVEDLAFRYAQLAQQAELFYAGLEQEDRQFGATFGLDAAALQQRALENAQDQLSFNQG